MHPLRLLFACSLLLGAARPLHAESAPATWTALLQASAAARPKSEVQDYYKLLVQATLGAEHAAPSETGALTWLEREMRDLGSGPDEPMVEPITPDGRLVRVNLRPFLAAGGDWRALARAFVETGRRKFGTRDELARHWALVIELAAQGRLPFGAEVARAYGHEMAAAGYPAVHHSAGYNATYHPAYRVVAREWLADLLPHSR